MAKRKVGKIIRRASLKFGGPDIEIPIAADLLKVDGVPQRDTEVSYYSREFPLESFSITQSASAVWAQKERAEHTPETEELYRDYQKKITPWINKIKRSGERVPNVSSQTENATKVILSLIHI